MNSTDLPMPRGALRLTDWSVIVAEGADAGSFLHGQLTQSIQNLSIERARLAGYCSAKGRLLASFVAFRWGAERFGLACSADLLAPTLKRLSMFVLRSKCKLADGGSSLAVWGLAGDAAGQWLGAEAAQAGIWSSGAAAQRESGRWIRLPDGLSAQPIKRWLLIADANAPAPDLPSLSGDDWAWLEVSSGIPRVTAATSDHFVPQMINFEIVGGVDFQKGCYPGQEVVARSQYRGTLKRRMVMMQGEAALAPGVEVHHSSDPGQPAGEVVLAAAGPGQNRFSALVEIKLAMLEPAEGVHTFTANGTPLQLGTLPYELISPT